MFAVWPYNSLINTVRLRTVKKPIVVHRGLFKKNPIVPVVGSASRESYLRQTDKRRSYFVIPFI